MAIISSRGMRTRYRYNRPVRDLFLERRERNAEKIPDGEQGDVGALTEEDTADGVAGRKRDGFQ
jgi:hypothetical protein